MTNIESLNDRFAQAFGRPNGIDPRFAWKHSSEVFFNARKGLLHGWERQPWLTRVGECWMLCQWRTPAISLTDWILQFGALPYPENGELNPHTETALPPGVAPTVELTDQYIASLRKQLEAAEFALRENYNGRVDPTTEQCEREAQSLLDANEQQFMEQVADWEPASWKLGEPHMPGDHDGPIAYQVGGLRDQQPATA